MTKSIQRTLAAMCLICVGFLPHNNAKAQIPVTDIAHIAESILQYITMIEQYMNMVERYKVLAQQLEEARGATDIGNAVADILNQSRHDMFPELPPSALYKEPKFAADTLFLRDSDAKQDYIARGAFIYSNIETVNDMYDKLSQRRANLTALRSEISGAITNKQILDLTARISVENGLLQNDVAMINLMNMSMDLSQQAVRHDESARRISNLRSSTDVK